MGKAIRALLLLAFSCAVWAQSVHVNGYFRKDGTWVAPHYRSVPDHNPYNNWSFPGNMNPYTGKVATGNPSTYLQRYYSHGNVTGSLPGYNLPTLPTLPKMAPLPALPKLAPLPNPYSFQPQSYAVPTYRSPSYTLSSQYLPLPLTDDLNADNGTSLEQPDSFDTDIGDPLGDVDPD